MNLLVQFLFLDHIGTRPLDQINWQVDLRNLVGWLNNQTLA